MNAVMDPGGTLTSLASYRPWLRDEFSFRCVYCLLREQWGQVRSLYAIDHFLPIASHPDRGCEYDNLLYTCSTCNAAKGSRIVPDPLVLLTSSTVRVEEDGKIHTDNPEVAPLLELLGLDSDRSCELRMLWMGIVALAAEHKPELYRKLMGYPNDLPNLGRLRPPGGNARPQGVQQSCFARKEAGSLPEIY